MLAHCLVVLRSSRNGLYRLSQFRNVAAPTWLRLWPDSSMSTGCAEVAKANPPVVFENS